MSLSPGARLGPYEILSTIGSGGMGEVYRCRDTRVPRTIVALKTLLPTVAEDADFRRRFTREAQIIARLEHPHICALYDVGDEEGTAYIVMPMLEGQPLADRLHGDPIPIAEALRIAVAVASALSYAHERGVLHRDVKPRNIMLGLDGSVKLVDFGVARTSRAAFDETTESATTLGGIIGTLEYMSPEQLAGRPIDPRSDIFSLGVVVYEMVAGRHPFRADTRTLTACAILDCNYPHISPGDPLLDAIDAVLSKAMAHDPAERFDTMAEFLNDLEMLQQASTPKAPEPSPVWNYRTPAIAFAVIVAIAALVILFGSLINSLNREPSPDARGTAAEPSGLVNARPRGNETGAPTSNYRHVTAPLSGQVTGAVRELGVTVWRLRRSTDEDPVRLLVHETGAAVEQWTPERVELGTPLGLGDRVRVSIESPRAGHLYVINRERYADGSTGVAQVIFPTRHTSGGDNRLLAGRLIDIPAQTDRPPYFTLRRSRADQTAELLTVIVSDQPLMELTPSEQPLQITSAMLDQLEHRGSTTLEQLEMVGGAGRAWSREEQDAAADRTRLLTQDAPAPQTVFRIVTNEPGFLVARVTLAHQTDSRTR